MKKTTLLVITLFLSAPLLWGQKKILIVGDSWAETIWRSRALDQVLQENGFPAGLTEGGDGNGKEGDLTAIGGSRADQWASNHREWQERIKKHIEGNPDIKTVHVVIGGNDLLNIIAKQDISGWTDERRHKEWETIQGNIRKLAEFCLGLREDLRVLIADYDYLNIANAGKAYQYDFGGMTQQLVNQYFVEVGMKKMELARDNDRIFYVQNWGTLNNHYANSLAPEKYMGAITEKEDLSAVVWRMPAAADVGDGIHPHPDAHKVLLHRAVEIFYKEEL